MSDNNLPIKIQTDGGLLELTPIGLLQHFLPGATLMKGSDRIYQGTIKKKKYNAQTDIWEEYDATVYVNKEALIGMCMEAQQKGLNPISQMYLIPSNSPHKAAGHKAKYTAGIERVRTLPGFLGINSGCMVLVEERVVDEEGKTHMITVVKDRFGSVLYPGDTLFGFYAEAFIAGCPTRIRLETPIGDYKKELWMGCKAARDELCTNNLAAMGIKREPPTAPAQHDLLLEAAPHEEAIIPIGTAAAIEHQPAPPPPPTAYITEPQRKRLFELCKEAGITYDTLKVFLREEHGIESNAKIPTDRYDTLCAQVTDGVVAAWRDAPSDPEPQMEEDARG